MDLIQKKYYRWTAGLVAADVWVLALHQKAVMMNLNCRASTIYYKMIDLGQLGLTWVASK